MPGFRSLGPPVFLGRVPVNKELFTGRVPVNKELITGTLPVNNLFLLGYSGVIKLLKSL